MKSDQKDIVKFFVNDHNDAMTWYQNQLGQNPTIIGEDRVVFDLKDAWLVLVNPELSNSQNNSTRCLH